MIILFNSYDRVYSWLSCFSDHHVYYRTLRFACAEAAYQWAKLDENQQHAYYQMLSTMQGSTAKQYGKSITPRKRWDQERVAIMTQIQQSKFNMCDLALKLVETQPHHLIHEAPWDAFWGNGRDGEGQNMLGRILMKIRDQ